LFKSHPKMPKPACELAEHAQVFSNSLNLTEMLLKQGEIDRAMLHKLKKQENTFVHLVEADRKDIYMMHEDSWPLYVTRMKIWGFYLNLSEKCMQIVKSPYFEAIISVTIMLNCLVMAMDSPIDNNKSGFTASMELLFFVVYLIEMALKMLALGLVFGRDTYFRDPWNILDFFIIFASLVSIVSSNASSSSDANSINFSSLRSLRILRPLRTINTIKKLRALIQTILDSLPYLLDILIIILFTMGVFAITGLQLFKGIFHQRCFEAETGRQPYVFDKEQLCGGSQVCPSGYICGKSGENPLSGMFSYDNVFSSYLSVFIVISMEGWSVLSNYTIFTYSWFSIAYYVSIVFIEGFFLFNLALAIISAKFNEAQENQQEDTDIEYLNSSSSLYPINPRRQDLLSILQEGEAERQQDTGWAGSTHFKDDHSRKGVQGQVQIKIEVAWTIILG
jgi:hypothetical protein